VPQAWGRRESLGGISGVGLMLSRGTTVGVSVVVPVYGGGPALEQLVVRAQGVLQELPIAWEILLVDDASGAPTCEIARRVAE
jgi:hypothetical protein